MSGDDLSGAAEDYLKAIYAAERVEGAARTNDLARELGIAAPSVTGMVRRLADLGLVNYEPYRGATLTAAGKRAALRTLRRHRVIETYLTTVLGYPWDRVHAEAERLEHAASDELIEHLSAAMGDPVVDPHGAPIPTRDGRVANIADRPLVELADGKAARITSVPDHDPALLQYLKGLGLLPGVEVKVELSPQDAGLVFVRVGSKRHAIGSEVARAVRAKSTGTRHGNAP